MSTSPNTTSVLACKKGSTPLGSSYTPTPKCVIVGRGKVSYMHQGNLRLANIVRKVIDTYSEAEDSKKAKSDLIKRIVDQVRADSPGGGFVKYCNATKQWFEVGDRMAREKVSQTFRDALTDNYRSSTTSKTLRRRQERITRQGSEGSKSSSGVRTATASSELPSSVSAGTASFLEASPKRQVAFSPLSVSMATAASMEAARLPYHDLRLAAAGLSSFAARYPPTVPSSSSLLRLMSPGLYAYEGLARSSSLTSTLGSAAAAAPIASTSCDALSQAIADRKRSLDRLIMAGQLGGRPTAPTAGAFRFQLF